MITKTLTESNLDDAKSVIRDRFDESCFALLEKELRNPGLRLYPEAGDIVYDDDGTPIAFQANMPRRVFLGQKEFVGMVGGMTCRKKDSPAESYIDLRVAANRHFKNGLLGFGNTCCRETASAQGRIVKKRNSLACNPPLSYSRLRIGLIRPIRAAIDVVLRKIRRGSQTAWPVFSTLDSVDFTFESDGILFRRAMGFSADFFDRLMESYLQTNKGLFCSRTAEELRWAFQDGISSGRNVLICAFENDAPVGYIIVKMDFERRRCQVGDWFARENDLRLLEALVKAAKRFLRQHTPVLAIETFGFPTFVQPIIERHFPIKRELGHNMFAWAVSREMRDEVLKIADTSESWFFGPYDGDGCF